MTSKPMEGETDGRSLGGALKAAQAVSACRWREPGPGFSMELREPVVSDAKGAVQVATPQEPEYRCEALGRSRS